MLVSVHFQCAIEINMFRVNSFDFAATIMPTVTMLANMFTLAAPNVENEQNYVKEDRIEWMRWRQRRSSSFEIVIATFSIKTS